MKVLKTRLDWLEDNFGHLQVKKMIQRIQHFSDTFVYKGIKVSCDFAGTLQLDQESHKYMNDLKRETRTFEGFCTYYFKILEDTIKEDIDSRLTETDIKKIAKQYLLHDKEASA